MLLQNARWFTRIRWVAVCVLFALGIFVKVFSGALSPWCVVSPSWWPWILAGALAGLNLVFVVLLRPARGALPRKLVVIYTWLQILMDLTILTILVHEVGSEDTVIAFAFLFHIVMACIFFVPRDSFLVTVLAAVLFLGCSALETAGVLPRHSLLSGASAAPPLLMVIINAMTAVFIWFVVWYLASSLSKSVQERDRELATANELLIAADREKNLLMLRTVHDLKAPFSCIESNIEVLKLQDWEALPASARTLINSIEVRATTLRERIKDILLLGELRESSLLSGVGEPVDLDELLRTTIEDLAGKARQRRVTVRLTPGGIGVRSNRKQLGILFSNVIANAIAYSHEDGKVEVAVEGTAADARVKISDHGIGISGKALPRIFEEYFRAPEAAQFNALSTGLGLAIVKHVAQSQGLVIHVTSEEGKGTAVEVVIPRERRGVSHGANCNR